MSNYEAFYNEAKYIFKDRIFNDYLRCFAHGVDASCYKYIPKIVIIATNEAEIKEIFRLARTYKTPLNFRAAGTSLSGQSCTDSVLVVIKFAFKELSVNKDASEISLGCGVVGINANNALSALGKKIGPDPATINSAQIGGIINNNSSGMCCGTKDNSYKTLASVRVILSDGATLDTADAKSIDKFRHTHAPLLKKLRELKEQIRSDAELETLIKRKFKIKNTTGYSLNAFVDFDDEIDILAHLFVGSEGTLGFLSRVRLRTIDDLPHKACALLFFSNISEAALTISEFAKHDFLSSAEIMDYASLLAASEYDELKELLSDIEEGHTCVLVQTDCTSSAELERNIEKIKKISKNTYKSYFSKDKNEYDLWWKIRKALLPIAASKRAANATVITEDVCFEIKDLARGIEAIQELFREFNFAGIIFGHALAGNIHFIITPNLNDAREFENFSKLVEKMSRVVANLGGSIKAEHGTGRMVAPFVELEWGKKAYEINLAIKQLFDSENLLNPDVIITSDAEIYKKNIKNPSLVDEALNLCMECGFCERFCPSNAHTLSPRQRIAVLKEMQYLSTCSDEKSRKNLAQMKKFYNYFVDASCAACSVCSMVCPLGINFADFSLKYRRENAGKIASFISNLAYKNHSAMLKIAKGSLKIANKFDNFSLNNALFKLKLPQSREYLPRANDFTPRTQSAQQNFIYFTSCLNKVFKPNEKMHDKRALQEVVESLCQKAGIGIIYAPNNLCCGKAYDNNASIQAKNKQKLREFIANTDAIVVSDHSACAAKMKGLGVMDLAVFLLNVIASRLKIRKISEPVGLYIMCAARKSGYASDIEKLARLCADEIYIDSDTFCCGFAGYKGFLLPRLNESATMNFKRFFTAAPIKRGFSSSSTCEIGLSDATKISWQHIAYLLDECSSSLDTEQTPPEPTN